MDSGCADFTNMGSGRMLKCQIIYFDIVDLSANIYLELELESDKIYIQENINTSMKITDLSSNFGQTSE